ncbi:MAG: hypothetical protein ABI435_04540 [Pseudolysinimonas sp.]
MVRARALTVLAVGVSLLAGCTNGGQLTDATVIGSWAGGGATLDIRKGGERGVVDLPDFVALHQAGDPSTASRFDSTCRWSIDDGASSGYPALAIDHFDAEAPSFGVYFEYQRRASGMCLTVTLGDPDNSDYFEMCEHTPG